MDIDLRDRARRWFTEVWANRDRALIEAWMHPEVAGFSAGTVISGRATWIAQVFDPFVAAFPDLKFEVRGIFVEGDEVMTRWRFCGTHRGDALGVAACGRVVTLDGMTWMRFQDGLIVEGQDCFDTSGLMLALQQGHSQGGVCLA
jgi:predicted ester cyclase